MNEKDEASSGDISEVEQSRQWEWLALCRELFCGPDKMGPILTPEGEKEDLYDVLREAQAILS